MTPTLPIDTLEPELRRRLTPGAPGVVSAPTGSGKSTQVPRWCQHSGRGPVLVVEPRRVACRSLAQRVAELEGTRLGEGVGYWVRDDQRVSEDTRITFATPGIVLRIAGEWPRYRTVILDEFHERTLDVDLLLALLQERYDGHRLVMSATLEAERVAEHLGGWHLEGEGRVHEVDVRHHAGKTLLPDRDGLEGRVLGALGAARDLPGDVLVFLPGKGEISSCEKALAGHGDWEILELHGGLSLGEQNRAFEPASRRKVILATNVAETSITLPGIGVVIDSGLVRRTRYHGGRGFLTLVAVAKDSAEQRKGRAGRTGPGVCIRLWDPAAQLEERTPPEVHRESLVPLVLAAAACGERVEELPFLDPPREHAVDTAREELRELGAVDDDGRVTPRGRQLFGLPLDAALGALLVEAEARARGEKGADGETGESSGDDGVLRDVVDLVSVLAPGRRIFARGEGKPRPGDPPWTMEEACDAVAILQGLRGGGGVNSRRLDGGTRAEARVLRRRLEKAFELGSRPPADAPVDRRRLALTLLGADPRRAHVARYRGRRTAWSNGGTEIEVARESGLQRTEAVEALVVLDTMALGLGGTDTRILATATLPVPLSWLVAAGLGRQRVGRVTVGKSHGRPVRLVATLERVFARRVLETTEEVPTGEHAREAAARLFAEGRLFRPARECAEERLEAWGLARDLAQQDGAALWQEALERFPKGVPEVEVWARRRFAELGLESGEEIALLAPEDLEPDELPHLVRQELDRTYPRRLELPDATYRLRFDLRRRKVILDQVEGRRREPPPVSWLPSFTGFTIQLRRGDLLRTLRDRRGRLR